MPCPCTAPSRAYTHCIDRDCCFFFTLHEQCHLVALNTWNLEICLIWPIKFKCLRLTISTQNGFFCQYNVVSLVFVSHCTFSVSPSPKTYLIMIAVVLTIFSKSYVRVIFRLNSDSRSLCTSNFSDYILWVIVEISGLALPFKANLAVCLAWGFLIILRIGLRLSIILNDLFNFLFDFLLFYFFLDFFLLHFFLDFLLLHFTLDFFLFYFYLLFLFRFFLLNLWLLLFLNNHLFFFRFLLYWFGFRFLSFCFLDWHPNWISHTSLSHLKTILSGATKSTIRSSSRLSSHAVACKLVLFLQRLHTSRFVLHFLELQVILAYSFR